MISREQISETLTDSKQRAYLKIATNEGLTDVLLADIIKKHVPGIAAVLDGAVEKWNKNSDVVQVAKAWTMDNAEFLANLTRFQQRWHGLQFTEKTPPVCAFNKLLRLVGARPVHLYQSAKGIHHYGLAAGPSDTGSANHDKP